ncbi:MAG: hypothetical protein EXS25_03560 [Pedosphaera sp.]|nr:hypothetical protein [Pedosphaera sp.]
MDICFPSIPKCGAIRSVLALYALKFQEVDIRRVRLPEFEAHHYFISVSWLNFDFRVTSLSFKRFLFVLATIVTTVTCSLRADTSVVFNEIMYHPSTNEALFEWIELRNQMAVDVDLSGWSITGGSRYAFPSNTVVRGGGFVLVAASPSTLSDLTGVSVALFGPFIGTNRLSNNGETLRLRNNSGRVVDEITYGTDGDWPVASNGSGASLAKRDPDSSSSPPENWTWSSQTGGTPGTANFPSAPALGIVFNELSVSTQSEFWLELFNAGKDRLSLEGCVLVQDGGSHHEYVFTATPELDAGGYRVITTTTLGFLPVVGDKLYLMSPSRATVLDAIGIKQKHRGRSPDGTGPFLFPNISSPGKPNSFAFHEEIVINEIMYDPRTHFSTDGVPSDASKESWLELHNKSSYPINLEGWGLDGGIGYSFGRQIVVAGGYLVVAKDVVVFRSLYPSTEAVGNFEKNLSGRGETVILRDAAGNPADQVRYFVGGRWPSYPAGGGSSLELRDPHSDNSKAEAWAASSEAAKTAWQTFSYRSSATASVTSGPDEQWREFVLGLLGDGECWIDDISVVQSPTNSPVRLLSNGNFENGSSGWRLLGNHSRSQVEVDPDSPGNHLLHLFATGPQEHMHNHLETKLVGGLKVVNGMSYEISFRARHIAGNNLLNTRLYFNRVARTTPLPTALLNGTPGTKNSRHLTNSGPTFAALRHEPVVPLASQPVTVSVATADPEGVIACQLEWSITSGRSWSSIAMTPKGDGLYSGTIPAQAAATVVQFFVRATDGAGAISTYPSAGINSGALYKVKDGAANLALTHNIRIILTPANTTLLHASTNVMSNNLLPCTIIYDERRAFYDAAVHLKSSQRGRDDAGRVGFHLVFQPDDLFRGVHPVMLIDRSNSGRPSCEEILLRHMVLQSGVPMPHPDICRVLAPQNAQTGQAIFSPRYEDDFIETAFDKGSAGKLFELELIYYPTTANAAGYKLPQPDGVQGIDISNLGNNKESYRYNFILKNHRLEDDYSGFIRFAKSWSLSGAELDSQTPTTTDWDEWMRAYSLVSLMGVGDMYSFGNNHNLMVYQRPSDQRMLYLPWDMDFSFNRGASSGLIGDQNIGRIIRSSPAIQRLFYGHMLDHIQTVFNANYMTYWFNRYDDFTLGQNFSSGGGLNFIQQRGAFAKSTISSLAGSKPFDVTGPETVVSATNLLTFAGTAPVQVKKIWVNGTEFPVVWTSLTSWSMRVLVSSPTTVLSLVGYDVHDQPISRFSKTITVNYIGQATPLVGRVVFNEIMPQPAMPDAAYVELLNTSSNTVDLSGWRLNGLDYTFPFGSYIAQGQYVVLVSKLGIYRTAYPAAPAPFGQFEGTLRADGETLTLLQPRGPLASELIIDQVRYETREPWPASAKGTGSSLQLIDPFQDRSRAGNWMSRFTLETNLLGKPSSDGSNSTFVTAVNGALKGIAFRTPGTKNSFAATLPAFPSLWISEIQAENRSGPTNSIGQRTAWLELHNSGSNLINLEPLFLSTHAIDLTQWRFPLGATIKPSEFKLIYTDGLSQLSSLSELHTGFSLPATRGSVFLSRLYSEPSFPTPVGTDGRTATAFAEGSVGYELDVTPVAGNLLSAVGTTLSLSGGAPSNPTGEERTSSSWSTLVDGSFGLVPASGGGGPGEVAIHDNWILTYTFAKSYILSMVDVFSGWGDSGRIWQDFTLSYATESDPAVFIPLTKIAYHPSGNSTWVRFNTPPVNAKSVRFDFGPQQNGHVGYTELVVHPLSASSVSTNQQAQVIDYLNYTVSDDRSFGTFPAGQSFDRQEFYFITPGALNNPVSQPLRAFINEWMADNSTTVSDPADGNFEDWFEIFNPGPEIADLSGFYLTDTLTNKFQYQIPRGYKIPVNGHLLVWADNEPNQNQSNRTDLHVNFKLSGSGDSIGLFATDGTLIDSIVFGVQAPNLSKGRWPDGGIKRGLMKTPTPRMANLSEGNTPPVLGLITEFRISEGRLFTFTARALDADLPAQVLTFTLSGQPIGASMTADGLFSWTPSGASAAGVYTFVVRVSDSGQPSQMTVQTVRVTVDLPPRNLTVTRTNDREALLGWQGVIGRRYLIEYSDALELGDVVWQAVGVPLVSSSDLMTFNLPIAETNRRFYRVKQIEE